MSCEYWIRKNPVSSKYSCYCEFSDNSRIFTALYDTEREAEQAIIRMLYNIVDSKKDTK